HALAEFGVRRGRAGRQVDRGVARDAGLDLAEHRDRGADLARRAEAALVAVVLHERGLHRMEASRLAEALDRRDFVAVLHHGEREARADAPSVDDHRTRAALALVAA